MLAWDKNTELSVEITRNPSRTDVEKLLKQHGAARAMRDPAAGELYIWGFDLGRHVDAASVLNLSFNTREELQARSFVVESLDDFDALRRTGKPE